MRMFRLKSRRGEAGYSVLELAVIVMIGGIITTSSVALFANGKARFELSRKAQNLGWQIERARSLAVKYNQTLTLGFGQDGSFGLTCSGCASAKSELSSITFPSAISFSSRPTLTITGNGTISGSSEITLSDTSDRQVTVTVGHSGRVSVGSITMPQRVH